MEPRCRAFASDALSRSAGICALGIAAVVLLVGGVGGWAATTEFAGAVIAPGSSWSTRTSRRCSTRPAAWSAS